MEWNLANWNHQQIHSGHINTQNLFKLCILMKHCLSIIAIITRKQPKDNNFMEQGIVGTKETSDKQL